MSVVWITETASLGAIAPSDSVALIGDSLAVGLTNPLSHELANFTASSKGGTDVRAWLTGFMSSSLNNVLAAKPTLVLVSLGTNDTAPASQPDAATIKSRVTALVDKVRAAGSTPVWLLPGTLPWNTDALLSSITATGVRTIAQPPVTKPDKIHPSGAGYATWAKAIADDLSKQPSTTGLSRRGGFLSGALVIAAAVGLLWATLRVRGQSPRPARALENPRAPRWQRLPLREATECGVRFATGEPVTFEFVRNTERAPYFGSTYQQDIEPAGRYTQHACGAVGADLPRGWVLGTESFARPLVLSFSDPPTELDRIYGPWSWKARLHEVYKKRGRALSRALVAEGFDGIVTVWRSTTREIVSLRTGAAP